jgi:radical SAM superfamily enzyme YgiQ (UPF0313 family)
MKVCLCSVPTEDPNSYTNPKMRAQGSFPILPKMAIVSLIKAMEANDLNTCSFYDIDMILPSDDEIRDFFRRDKPDIIGLSAVVSSSYPQIKRISALIREVLPDSIIAMGGNLGAISDIVMKTTDIDLCFVGEGERSWIAFLKKNIKRGDYTGLDQIRGLAYYDNDTFIFTGYGEGSITEDLFMSDYEMLEKGFDGKSELIQNYFRKTIHSPWFAHDKRVHEKTRRPNMANFMTSKGCTAKCTFCQRSLRGYKTIDIERIENHLIELKEKYDVGCLHIVDENFGSDVKYTHKLAETFKKYDMLWVASGVRCTNVTPEDIAFYAENNCLGLKFGVESGSQVMLDVMEKKFNLEDVQQGINACREHKVYSPLALLIGMPGETNETVMESARLIGEYYYKLGVKPSVFGCDLNYAMAFPGSPIYTYGQQVGVIGTSLEDECAYLSNIMLPFGSKYNHVNLSGQKLKDLLFWVYLMALESERVYYENVLKYGPKEMDPVIFGVLNTPGGYSIITDSSDENKFIRKLKKIIFYAKSGTVLQRALLSFYTKDILFNYLLKKKITSTLPRGLVYGVLREINYIKYRFFKGIGVVKDNLNKTNTQTLDLGEGPRRKERSLRSFIQKLDTPIFSLRNGI